MASRSVSSDSSVGHLRSSLTVSGGKSVGGTNPHPPLPPGTGVLVVIDVRGRDPPQTRPATHHVSALQCLGSTLAVDRLRLFLQHLRDLLRFEGPDDDSRRILLNIFNSSHRVAVMLTVLPALHGGRAARVPITILGPAYGAPIH